MISRFLWVRSSLAELCWGSGSDMKIQQNGECSCSPWSSTGQEHSFPKVTRSHGWCLSSFLQGPLHKAAWIPHDTVTDFPLSGWLKRRVQSRNCVPWSHIASVIIFYLFVWGTVERNSFPQYVISTKAAGLFHVSLPGSLSLWSNLGLVLALRAERLGQYHLNWTESGRYRSPPQIRYCYQKKKE